MEGLVNMNKIPDYWKSTADDIVNMANKFNSDEVEIACLSAGGRPIYLFRRGSFDRTERTANVSSALGSTDIRCYVDRNSKDRRPVLFLVGGVHGAEFEGTVMLMNLLKLMNDGTDFCGNTYPELSEMIKKIDLMIIPCANPDGRSHIPFDSMVDRTFGELRYYNQGTWKDGTLCNWPDCKKVHPIKDAVEYLGGYFNDDGINMMHDNFFGDKAAETKLLLDLAEQYAPDFTVLYHGCADAKGQIFPPTYAPSAVRNKIRELDKTFIERCKSENFSTVIEMCDQPQVFKEGDTESFNLVSALCHVCCGPCITYESFQGLRKHDDTPIENVEKLYDELYRQHMILVEEICRLVLKKNKGG